MVVARQVEQAVDDKMGNVVFERNALFPRFARAGLVSQHDVPQQHRRPSGSQVEQLSAGEHREGEHVGRLVLSPPLPVQRVDFGVACEQQAGREPGIGEFGYDIGSGRRSELRQRLPIGLARPRLLGGTIELQNVPSGSIAP